MSQPRVAIVGAGLMGRWHAHAARRAGGRVVAVADQDHTEAQALASRHPGAVGLPSLSDALAKGGIDVVHICTPLSSHLRLALEALDGGAHLVVEKPLAESLADTDFLLATAAAHDRLVIPVHQFPFQHGAREAARRLPEIGSLCQVHHLICSAGASGAGPDRADQVAVEVLPHPLSLLQRFLPGPLGEAAWTVRHPAPGELVVQGAVGGIAVGVVISMGGRPPVNQMILLGTRGTLRIDLFHGFVVREPGTASRAGKVRRPFALASRELLAAGSNLVRRVVAGEVAYPGLDTLVLAFYAAIRGAGPPPISARQTREVAEACAVIRSAVVSAGEWREKTPRRPAPNTPRRHPPPPAVG